MRRSFLVLIFVSLIVFMKSKEMDPPLWPEHFSQSFEVETSSSNQTGRMWIDYTVNKFRFDFEHPDERTLCDIYSEYSSPCTHLGINGKLYIFLPQEELCCFFQGPGLPPRDWLKVQNYIYTGEVYLDGQYFYRWQHYNWTHVEYLADKSEKRIPKRDAKDKIILDFWLDSYNDSPISPSILNVPNYCEKACSYNEAQRKTKTHQFKLRKVSDLISSLISSQQKKE